MISVQKKSFTEQEKEVRKEIKQFIGARKSSSDDMTEQNQQSESEYMQTDYITEESAYEKQKKQNKRQIKCQTKQQVNQTKLSSKSLKRKN